MVNEICVLLLLWKILSENEKYIVYLVDLFIFII